MSGAKFWAGLGAVAACLSLIGAAGAASAQTAPPAGASTTPSRQEVNPVERTPARPAERQPELFSAPTPPPCPLSGSELTFKLTSVEIKGAVGVPPAALDRTYADEVGRQLPVSAICEIRDRVAAALFHSGLLARVEIPEQTIAAGRLQLEVIEARIVSVRVHGDAGPGQDKIEAYLDRLRGLTPFNLDTAQRALLLARDVPGMTVTASLSPSAQGRGAVDLDVQVSRNGVNEQVAVQNTGSKSLGRWSALGRVDLNSFTSFGERTSLIVYSTLFDDEQQVIQAIEEARLGASGLQGRVSFAYGKTHPGGVLAELKLNGTSEVGTAELDYPLVRLQRADVNLGAGFDLIDQLTKYSNTGTALTNDHLRVFWLRADSDAEHRFNSGLFNGVLVSASGNLEARTGVSALGATQGGRTATSHLGAEGAGWEVRFTGTGEIRPDPFVRLSGEVIAQYTQVPLLSYEQIEAGNLTIGRGYDPAALSGDRGVTAEAKLEFGPFQIPRVSLLEVLAYGFFDVADIEILGGDAQKRTIRSRGLGLTFDGLLRLKGLRADVAYAAPIDRTYVAAPVKPPARVLFQLSFIH